MRLVGIYTTLGECPPEALTSTRRILYDFVSFFSTTATQRPEPSLATQRPAFSLAHERPASSLAPVSLATQLRRSTERDIRANNPDGYDL